MKKVIASLLLVGLVSAVHSQTIQIKGRVVDQQMEYAIATEVSNLKTHQYTMTDKFGYYNIKGSIGDTIEYKSIGCTNEYRIIANERHLDVLLMDKTVNDLGAIWTKRQWKRAERSVNKTYKQLETKAKKLGIWDYE